MMAQQQANEQRSPLCTNCQCNMRLDQSMMKRAEEFDRTTTDADLLECARGQSKSLLHVICHAEIPGDAPCCKDCADALQLGFNQQLSTLKEECCSYNDLVQTLRLKYSSSDVQALKTNLKSLQDEEEELRKELKQLEDVERKLDDQFAKQKQLAEEKNPEEMRLWHSFRDNHSRLLEIDESSRNLDAELKYASAQHQRLSGLNVLDLCFHIWVDAEGTIGEINGFRLGRLPDRPVDWPEINAAWGQCVLLLDVLMQRMNVRQENYQLIAMGSHSSIKVKWQTGESTNHPLYGSGNWKPFGNNNTDLGIQSFLECFLTLAAALKAQDSSFVPQYRVKKDRLISNNMEYSAKMLLNSEERWTKAMRLLLANLRWAINQVVAVRPPA